MVRRIRAPWLVYQSIKSEKTLDDRIDLNIKTLIIIKKKKKKKKNKKKKKKNLKKILK